MEGYENYFGLPSGTRRPIIQERVEQPSRSKRGRTDQWLNASEGSRPRQRQRTRGREEEGDQSSAESEEMETSPPPLAGWPNEMARPLAIPAPLQRRCEQLDARFTALEIEIEQEPGPDVEEDTVPVLPEEEPPARRGRRRTVQVEPAQAGQAGQEEPAPALFPRVARIIEALGDAEDEPDACFLCKVRTSQLVLENATELVNQLISIRFKTTDCMLEETQAREISRFFEANIRIPHNERLTQMLEEGQTVRATLLPEMTPKQVWIHYYQHTLDSFNAAVNSLHDAHCISKLSLDVIRNGKNGFNSDAARAWASMRSLISEIHKEHPVFNIDPNKAAAVKSSFAAPTTLTVLDIRQRADNFIDSFSYLPGA